jgi:hypothetical protein
MEDLIKRINDLEETIKIHHSDLRFLIEIIKHNDWCAKTRHEGLVDIIHKSWLVG